MARRGPLHDVELVEDDGPDDVPLPDATPPAPPDHRRRRVLVAGGLLVTALVAGAAVGQGVVDRRERARVAAVAEQPGAVDVLTGPPTARWHATEDELYRAVAVRTPDGMLVGVRHVGEGPVQVAARDVATGAEAWRVELVDGTTRRPRDTPGRVFPWSGTCAVPPGQEHRVACLVHDGTRRVVDDVDDVDHDAPSVVRVVVLDTRDGSVVSELSDALALDSTPSSFVVTRDVVVVGTDTPAETLFRAVGWDGSPAWDLTVPVPAVETGGFSAYATRLEDLVAVVTHTELRLLDATGRTVRTDALRDQYVVTGWGGQLFTVPAAADGTTTVVRPAGSVEVEGELVPMGVDDGSVPGLVLTTVDRTLVAWDADGARLWSSDLAVPSAVLLLDGRVHLDDGLQLLALDARTGAGLWRSDVSSALPTTDGRHLLALAASARRGQRSELVALDPADGSERWRSPLPDGTDEVVAHLQMLVAIEESDGETAARLTVLR